MTRFLPVILISFLLMAHVSFAQEEVTNIDMNQISDLEIEEHFQKIDTLLTSETPDMDAVYAYADNYLAENFAMKHRVKSGNLKDSLTEDEAEEVLLSREAVLEVYQDRKKILYNSKLKHRIIDIEHNKDNNTAKITYSSLFKGTVKSQDKDGAWFAQDFTTLSNCYDLLKPVDGKIKSFRAECDVETIHKTPRRL